MKPFFRTKKGLVFIFIIIIFIVLNLTGFTKEIKNLFYLISSPIEKFLWQAGNSVSDFWDGILEAEVLKQKAENLIRENKELTSQIVNLKELEKENKSLRKALEIGLEKDFQLTLSQVISKDAFNDSVLINKGEKDGVEKGFPVITNQKVLVGKIGEVYENFAEVVLTTNKSNSFDAKILGKEIYGIIKGKGNLELYLDLVPKEAEIINEETVITAVLGRIFPENLFVGKIKEIKKSDVAAFQTAEIRPGFTIEELDYLFIITNF